MSEDQPLVWSTEKRKVSDLKAHPKNPRKISSEQMEKLKESIQRFNYVEVVAIDHNNVILAGHQRIKAMKALNRGKEEIEVRVPNRALSEAEADEYLIRSNKNIGDWDFDILANEWDTEKLLDFGFTEEQLLGDSKGIEENSGQDPNPEKKGCLALEFGYVPFSVFDTRTKLWLDRRRYWIDEVGIIDRVGRDEKLTGNIRAAVEMMKKNNLGTKGLRGNSSFDPMIAEIIYSWFVPVHGRILDPFAGGVTRGCVASALGHQYVGVDIRQEQIDSNLESFTIINERQNIPFPQPTWICGDSAQIDAVVDGNFDFVFSCPPYGDLEKYSDLSGDISNKKYSEFRKIYREIIRKCCEKLIDNSFACFVVGEIRDKNGNYFNFVPDTISAFCDAGMKFYNEIILVNSVGSAAVRVRRYFEKARKLAKVHQNILIFVKGDGKIATEKIGNVKYTIPEKEEELEDFTPEID